MLEEAQIKYARLDGTMTREDRAKACDSLRHNKKTEVLLVSTRAGGVGLNLTAASRCFLVDPYWNPSVEAQAIDRIVCPALSSITSHRGVVPPLVSDRWAREEYSTDAIGKIHNSSWSWSWNANNPASNGPKTTSDCYKTNDQQFGRTEITRSPTQEGRTCKYVIEQALKEGTPG